MGSPGPLGPELVTSDEVPAPHNLRIELDVNGEVMQSSSTADDGTWTVPGGSTLRLQQLLAILGYLPLQFNSSAAAVATPQAQEAAAIHPPKGAFSWRWSNVPSPLRSFWQPGTSER